MEFVSEAGSAVALMDTEIGVGPREEDQRGEKSAIPQHHPEKMLQSGEVESNIETSEEAKSDAENAQRTVSRLLRLACKFDSTASLSSLLERMPVDALDDEHDGQTVLHYAAEEHSVRCIELLLKRRAKTDVKSKEGLVALESALRSERLQILSWSPADKITELLTLTSDKDLTAIQILAGHTPDVLEIASRLIVHGNIVAFAALLAVTGNTLTSIPVHSTEEHGDGTLFDVIVKRAISLGEEVQDGELKNGGCSDLKHMLRQMLLRELELLLRWHLDNGQISDSRHRTPPTTAVPSPLLRAVQAGDVAVASIMLDYNAGVNDTDGDGNTALHWCLRAMSNTRDIRLVSKFVRSGASITAGNRLGLTPVHIAAGQGHLQALQILLAVEPSSVHVHAETRETPLFSAVKGNHYDCVRLLLQHGASRQVLNLRKQRPIDVADTSDMRALLSLQESSGKVKNLSLTRSSGMFSSESDDVSYDIEHLKIKSGNYQPLDPTDESLKSLVPAKTEICRYFGMPGGCVRGEKCFYAHGEEDIHGRPRITSGDTKQGHGLSTIVATPARLRASEDLSRKIFVGGLSPSVESDDLREFFEDNFGPVMDAIVIGSHSGDQVQSRGFGFVTFKHEDSVIAAVQAHYVNIFGKKVEIKGAVPRSGLSTLESTKVSFGFSRLSGGSSELLEGATSQMIDLSSLELLCQAKTDVQAQWIQFMGYQGEGGALPFKLSLSEDQFAPKSAPSSASSSSPSTSSSSATWVVKFKQWLPKFLAEVSNRLKEGEWYPLSSLKGDFRATCGLELDHAGIGYHKLSDFVRSLPELCRMKIVPVGRGPATHMVLLPPLARLTPVATTLQHQAAKASGSIADRSLVDVGRSYAAAACHGYANSLTRNLETSGYPTSLVSQPRLPRQPPSQFEYGECPNPRYADEIILPDNLLPLDQINPSDSTIGHASILPSQYLAPNSPMQDVDATYLKELIALLDNTEGQEIDNRPVRYDDYPRESTNSYSSNMTQATSVDDSEPHTYQARSGTSQMPIETQEEPKTPVNQVNLKPFSTFNHPFAGFLPLESGSSAYNMWGENRTNNQATMESSVQQSLQGKNLRQPWLWDDSPQSILYPYGRGYPQLAPGERPMTLFSPATSSPVEEQFLGAVCVFCRDRASMWVAVPCNHYSMCAVCKEALHRLKRSTSTCPVCECPVERWIALH